MSHQLPVLSLSAGDVQKHLIRQIAPRGAAVIWVDGDAEIIVDGPALRVALHPGIILIELSFVSDQTQRTSLVFPFSVGRTLDDAALLAVTEEHARGHKVIAARWGSLAQDMLWRSLLQVGQTLLEREFGPDELSVGGVYVDEQLHYLAVERATMKDIINRARG
jgi:hypothetical protein